MNGEVMPMLLSVAIGGVIGFCFSYFMWITQIKYNKRNVAQGFYLEISTMEKDLKLYDKMMLTNKIHVPFYTNYGLFFTFRKEIFRFSPDLSKRLFEFYSYLLKAEKYRKIRPSDKKLSKEVYDEMQKCITKALELLPKIKELLKKECS